MRKLAGSSPNPVNSCGGAGGGDVVVQHGDERLYRRQRPGSERDDGDVAGGIQASLPNSGVDVLMGVGGTPEGVIVAVSDYVKLMPDGARRS